jgi:hypothetical protein
MIDEDLIKDYRWLRDKYDFFLHTKCLRQAALDLNLKMQMDIQSLHVTINNKNKIDTLYPKYIYRTPEGVQSSTNFYDNTAWFAGWSLSDKPIVVNNFKDKLHFKKLLIKASIPTPSHSSSNNHSLDNFIIKKAQSSGGRAILGPFKASDHVKRELGESEFFEAFIEGEILKIWFWNELPICLERQGMPKVIGDGVAPILDLIKRTYCVSPFPVVLPRLNQFLSSQGYCLESILEKGKSQLLEFIYGKGILIQLPCKLEMIDDIENEDFMMQLLQVGDLANRYIQEEGCNNLIYTVDGICDSYGKLWILEANSYPVMHPLLYQTMLSNLVESHSNNYSILSTP